MRVHFILYVADQDESASFYQAVLGRTPDLHVPGMTEFHLGPDVVLGLMPERGAERLLGIAPVDERRPRAEVYLVVADAAAFHRRALEAGAVELSPLADRDWGATVAYSQDRDGHVLAFAEA